MNISFIRTFDFFFQISCFLHWIQSVYPHLFCSLYDNGSPLYWRFLLRSVYAILVKIWKWLKLLNSVQFIKKTLVNHVCIRISSSWLTFTVLQWKKTNVKISQFSRFLLWSKYAIQIKIWKWLKLLNSVKFIKKPLVNEVYIWIGSFWLTFTVLQWMKANAKISQFSSFLLRSGYVIQVKIW